MNKYKTVSNIFLSHSALYLIIKKNTRVLLKWTKND